MSFVINLYCFGLSLYVLLESFGALCSIPGCWHCFCHKAKYTLALMSSAWLLVLAVQGDCSPVELLFVTTLALFVWPRFLWRMRAMFNGLELFHGN